MDAGADADVEMETDEESADEGRSGEESEHEGSRRENFDPVVDRQNLARSDPHGPFEVTALWELLRSPRYEVTVPLKGGGRRAHAPAPPRACRRRRCPREAALRRACRGEARKHTALFGDEHGAPFRDATFAAIIMAALRAVVCTERAKLLSPHSWRVWIASSLRMCGV